MGKMRTRAEGPVGITTSIRGTDLGILQHNFEDARRKELAANTALIRAEETADAATKARVAAETALSAAFKAVVKGA